MSKTEPFSSISTHAAPRHAHQEIADLLGTALCRLLSRNAALLANENSTELTPVRLGFSGTQSVYGNSSQPDAEFDYDVN
jgi:hypothetical protein